MQRKRTNARKTADKSQRGYVLVAVMLIMALMLIALSVELPRISQQIKREKEEELVHRGLEYATAIKRYRHKTGTYPVSLDQLESTNNLRFLRRRFKDPMTESGEFRLVHVGEAQITVPTTALNNNPANNPAASASGSGTAGSNSNTSGGLNSNSGGFNSGGLSSGGLNSGGLNSGALGSGGLGGSMGPGGLGSGNPGATGAGGVTGTTGTNQPGGTGTMGTLTTQNIGNGMGVQGGQQIIGVASTSKKRSIKEFNQNDEYDQWLFVYDPRVEQAGAGGVIIASPTAGGSANSSAIPQPVQPVRAPAPQ